MVGTPNRDDVAVAVSAFASPIRHLALPYIRGLLTDDFTSATLQPLPNLTRLDVSFDLIESSQVLSALKKLQKLKMLTLCNSNPWTVPLLPAQFFIDFIADAPALKRLVLAPDAARDWTNTEYFHVQSAAQTAGVLFELA